MYYKYMIAHLNKKGQALVEYLLLVVFLVMISSKVLISFTDFMRESVGGLGHTMTMNLMVGICKEECFYSNYKNGYKSQ